MNDADQELSRLVQPDASLRGYLPDFETVLVFVAYDPSIIYFALRCSTMSITS
jgi:hypothetical protein